MTLNKCKHTVRDYSGHYKKIGYFSNELTLKIENLHNRESSVHSALTDLNQTWQNKPVQYKILGNKSIVNKLFVLLTDMFKWLNWKQLCYPC